MSETINKLNMPKHIAITMDGNGRWAKERGKKRVFGHNNGVKSVRDTIEGAVEYGVKFLTLFAFSTENWKRPKAEVNALMTLLVKTIHNETKDLIKNNVSLRTIGDISQLPIKPGARGMPAARVEPAHGALEGARRDGRVGLALLDELVRVGPGLDERAYNK